MALKDLTGAVDFTVLETMMGGLDEVTLEVLELYTQQAALWAPMLDPAHEGCHDALHTLRGASAGIGANSLASLCAEAEALPAAAISPALDRVKTSLNHTLADVATYRHWLLMRSLSR